MAIKGAELHHHGIRIHPDALDASLDFYHGVLGLDPDPGRPNIPSVPGFWMDLGNDTQIHMIGLDGVSPLAQDPEHDPAAPHVALGVPDLEAAKAELDESGTDYWVFSAGLGLEQVFMFDPSGNMVELHQKDQCRCRISERPPVEEG